jgi:hypothetical protein
MSPAQSPSLLVRWLFVLVRVLLVTFLLALLAFAVFLFLGIVGLVIHAMIRGVHPNMTVAYRAIALPAGVAVGAIALMAAILIEVRYQQRKRGEKRLM